MIDKREKHYENTRNFFKVSAKERQGYYDAKNRKVLRHSIWQLRIRKIVLGFLDELLKHDSSISKVIDVGCGRGDFTIEIAKRYTQLNEIWGCDFLKENVYIACRNTGSLEKVSFKECELLNMPFKEKSFDLSLCINTIHHIHKDDLKKALSELARITSRYIIMEIKNKDNFYRNYIAPKTFSGMDIYLTSVKEANAVLQDYGFRLRSQMGIFLFNRLSPLCVVVYNRQV